MIVPPGGVALIAFSIRLFSTWPIRSLSNTQSGKLLSASLISFKPFCSARCRDVDLNRWLKGVYSVPATEDDDEDGERPREDEKE